MMIQLDSMQKIYKNKYSFDFKFKNMSNVKTFYNRISNSSCNFKLEILFEQNVNKYYHKIKHFNDKYSIKMFFNENYL